MQTLTTESTLGGCHGEAYTVVRNTTCGTTLNPKPWILPSWIGEAEKKNVLEKHVPKPLKPLNP